MILGLGHSTYPSQDFVEICESAGVDTIIDTRSHPGSSAHPQFNRGDMELWLPKAGINYEWWPSLGGWADRHKHLADRFLQYDVDVDAYCHNCFPKQRISKKKEGGWTCYGFHDYQHFMRLDEFQIGVQELIKRGQTENVACICCEACWTRCHRSMIADYLVFLGHDMHHVVPRRRKTLLPNWVTKLQPHSTVIKDRLSRYDEIVLRSWQTD